MICPIIFIVLVSNPGPPTSDAPDPDALKQFKSNNQIIDGILSLVKTMCSNRSEFKKKKRNYRGILSGQITEVKKEKLSFYFSRLDGFSIRHLLM